MPKSPELRKFGEVHAPIEDTDTPLGIKVLVVLLLMGAAIIVIAAIITAEQIGMLEMLPN